MKKKAVLRICHYRTIDASSFSENTASYCRLIDKRWIWKYL